MDIRLLGTVEASVDGRAVAVAPGKPRALLAMLALHAGSTVSSERLIGGLWAEPPPATATKLVQLHVSQLRKALGATATPHARARLRAAARPGGPRRHAGSSGSWPPGTRARGSPCGAARRSTTSPASRSRRRRSAGSRNCAWRRSSSRSSTTWPPAGIASASASSSGWCSRSRCASAARAADAGPVPLRPAGRRARGLPARPRRPGRGQRRRAGHGAAAHARGDPAPGLRAGSGAADRPARRPGGEPHRGRTAGAARWPRTTWRPTSSSCRRRARRHETDARVVVCPFKGLASFDVEDAEYFFGRERLVAELVARLTGARADRRSSAPRAAASRRLLRAGLLAALAGGVLPGSERWPIAVLRPGEHPLQELERASPDGDGRAGHRRRPVRGALHRLLRRGRARGVRRRAVRARPRRRAIVLIAIRADFYGHCAEHPELARQLAASNVLVGPMRRDELRRAIELPARRAGLEVEPELTDALLADVEGRPGALPLLSTALLELWQHRDGRRLRMSAYEHAGGVQGAVARLAERAYERLEPERRPVARRILLRLAATATATRSSPARPARRAGRATAWPRSRRCSPTSAWSRSARTRSRWRTRRCCANGRGCAAGSRRTRRDGGCTRTCARPRAAGTDAGRDPGELYRGARLASALEWAAAHDGELNAVERDFLAASRAASQRSQRRLRAVVAGLGVLLVLAVVAGAVALDQRAGARREATAAEAQRLGARALVEDDLDLSLLLARAGRRARRHAADARQPAGRAAAERRPRSACCAATAIASSTSTSARTSARWRSSTPTAR